NWNIWHPIPDYTTNGSLSQWRSKDFTPSGSISFKPRPLASLRHGLRSGTLILADISQQRSYLLRLQRRAESRHSAFSKAPAYHSSNSLIVLSELPVTVQ